MITLRGAPHNLGGRIIGKITRSATCLHSRDKIYIHSNNDSFIAKFRRFAGIIECSKLNDKLPEYFQKIVLKNDEELSSLQEGDIVDMNPDGSIHILHQADSIHNALYVTNRCNSRCIMCPQPPCQDEQSRVNDIIKQITLLSPNNLSYVGITGGEPTLLGDDLIKILYACNKYLGKSRIAILTNGKGLKDIDYLRDIVKVGVRDLLFCIPLYSSVDYEHDSIVNAKNSFYETIDGIHNLARFGQAIEIRNVVMKQNHSNLLRWADFIYRNFLFVSHIAIMGLEPTGIAKSNLEKVWIDPIDASQNILDAVHYFVQRQMNVSLFNMQLCTLSTETWKYSRDSISGWKKIYLDVCAQCSAKNDCAGLFESSREWHSKGIHPILPR